METAERARGPSLNDYLAGAMLANGLVWSWSMAMGYLSSFSPYQLADLSYVIYLLAGGIASYLVGKRARSRHISVALRLVAIEWAFFLFLMLSLAPAPTPSMAMVMLVCYLMSGVAGAYLALRSQLRSKSKPQTPQ